MMIGMVFLRGLSLGVVDTTLHWGRMGSFFHLYARLMPCQHQVQPTDDDDDYDDDDGKCEAVLLTGGDKPVLGLV